eukprot:5599-Heterococcus_DN1.PRE.2
MITIWLARCVSSQSQISKDTSSCSVSTAETDGKRVKGAYTSVINITLCVARCEHYSCSAVSCSCNSAATV